MRRHEHHVPLSRLKPAFVNAPSDTPCHDERQVKRFRPLAPDQAQGVSERREGEQAGEIERREPQQAAARPGQWS